MKAGLASNELQQRAGSALEIVMGSAQKATQQMEELRSFGSESPISMSLWIQAQQQMLAFGVSAERVVPLLQAIQNTALAGGGTEVEIERIIEVMARMSSSAEVTKGDLNVLGTQGVAAAQLVGNAFGKTANTIQSEITAGSLSVEEFYDGFITGADQAFSGVSDGVRQTFAGVIDRLRGVQRRIGEILATPLIDPAGGGAFIEIGNAIADVMNKVEQAIKPIVASFNQELQPSVDRVATSIRNMGNAVTTENIQKLIDRLAGIGPVAAAASAALGVAFVGNLAAGIPVIGQFAGALHPLAFGISMLAATSPELRAALTDLTAAFAPLIPVAADLATIVAQVLTQALKLVAPLISFVAQNLEFIVPAAVAAAGAMTVYGLASATAGTLSTAFAVGLLRLRDAMAMVTAAIAANPIGAIATVIGSVVVALDMFLGRTEDAIDTIKQFGDTATDNLTKVLDGSSGATDVAADSMRGLTEEYAKATDELAHLESLNALDAEWWNTRADAIDTAAAEVDEANAQFERLDQALSDAALSGMSNEEVMSMLTAQYGLTKQEISDLMIHMDGYKSTVQMMADNHAELADAVGESVAQLQSYSDELRAQADPAFAAIKAQQDLAEAQTKFNEVSADSSATQEDLTAAALAAAEAYLEWTGAAAEGAEAIMNGIDPAMAAHLGTLENGDEILGILQDAYGSTEEAINSTADTAQTATEDWIQSQYDLENATITSLAKITDDMGNTVNSIVGDYTKWSESGMTTQKALEAAANEYGLSVTEVADIVGAQTAGMTGYVEDWVISAKGQIDDLIFQGYGYAEALATVASRTGKSTGEIETAFRGARDAGLEFADDYPATVRVEGVAEAVSAAQRVQRHINNIDRTVSISFQTKGFQSIDGISIPRASGGLIRGPGTGTSDSVPVRASNGEFMIQKSAVDKYGAGFLSDINRGIAPTLSSGGRALPSRTSGNITMAAAPVGNITININGPVANRRAAEDMVVEGWREAVRKGRIKR